MARELSEVIRIRVSPAMRAELVKQAATVNRSAGAIARDAIRAHLEKGKR
jgi:hypothetical protein